MALTTEAQLDHATKVENLRTTIAQLKVQMVANAETTSRQLIQRRMDLDAVVGGEADLHLEVFGDGSEGTLANTVTGELEAVNTMVDDVITVTTKTRANLEAGE